MVTKQERRNKIKARIRGKVSGTAERPRMTVFRSNKQIYVQLVDDSEGKPLFPLHRKAWKAEQKRKLPQKWDKLLPKRHWLPALRRLCSTATVICSMAELNHWLMQHATADLNFKDHGN